MIQRHKWLYDGLIGYTSLLGMTVFSYANMENARFKLKSDALPSHPHPQTFLPSSNLALPAKLRYESE